MKLAIFIVSFFLVLPMLYPAPGDTGLLRIDPPDPQLVKKKSIVVATSEITEILTGLDREGVKANIDLATMEDFVVARFGKILNGKIEWAHKVKEGFMTVKFGKSEYKDLLEKIRSGIPRPGYQILLTDEKSNHVIQSREISFKAFPELSLEIKYPVNAAPGEPMAGKMSVTVNNTGTAPSGEFDVDLLVSPAFEIPRKRYEFSESAEGISLLFNGRIRMGPLAPGEKKEMDLPENIRLPNGLKSGKYYMGGIADPGNEIAEIEKENNIFKGFLVIAERLPDEISVRFGGTEITYIPKTFEMSVKNHGMEMSINDEWRKCQIRPYIFHLKHVSWKDFFWEVNTSERKVWKIMGGEFCKRGATGKAAELNIRISVQGGSDSIPPDRVSLSVQETEILYVPSEKKFSILLAGCNTSYPPFWKSCRTEGSPVHFKFTTWEQKAWALDAAAKVFSRIPLEKMCRQIEAGEPIDAVIRVKMKE